MSEQNFKVLICDGMSKEGLDILKAQPGFEVLNQKGISREDLLATIPECDAVVVRSATQLDREAISAGPKLKVLARAGVGLDNIDIEAATERGIVVMNTPSGNTTSAAEHTMALMLALARKIPQADATMKNGGWDRGKYVGREMFGKTLGIIGLGKIGREVAKRAQSFSMHTIGHDPFTSRESAAADGIEWVEFDDLLAKSDILTLHTPLTNDTRGIICEKTLSKMKNGAFLINCARGPLLNDADVAAALASGKLGGAAIDVYHEEPPKDSPLVGLPNVVATPHLGASTDEAQINVAIMIAEQIIDALLDREVRNAINMPRLDPESRRVIGPFIRLADELGQFAGQIVNGSLEKIEIHCQGEIANRDISPLVTGGLRGVLSAFMPESVNYVNAPHLAKKQGLRVESHKDTEATGFTNLITVKVMASETSRSVSGTIFEGTEIRRIMAIDDYQAEARPSGHLLLIRNKDQPGVVGLVGTILAKNGINISGMSLGPNRDHPIALEIINVDQQVSEKVLQELKSNELILTAKAIRIT
jgi:D-3-phosphoglycerate dehydrogenase